MEIIDLSIIDLKEKIASGELSRLEVVKAYLCRVAKAEPKINAFISVFNDEALKTATRLDNQNDKGALSGIPAGIKDLFCTKGLKTTAASKMLSNFIPPYNAEVVRRLIKNGSIILGKNNCDAWAHGASNENSFFGSAHNPWNLEKVPGGSSGGSAAAVAAGECAFSIGSDTGGSIRQPASFCGVVGLRPTYGRVSRYGLIAMASSLDAVGPITKTVKDAAFILSVIAGEDEKDATSCSDRVPDYLAGLEQSLKGKKVGVPKEYFSLGLDKEVRDAYRTSLKIFEDLGIETVEISLPHAKYGVAAYYIIQSAEVSSNLGRFDGIKYGYSAANADSLIDYYFKTRDEGFEEEAKRRIMLGTYVLSSGYYEAYYLKAQKVRNLIINDFKKAYEKVDLILSPVTPTTAFGIGEKVADPLAMYLTDVFTVQASLAGLPSISVPAGFSKNKMPIGIQLIGPRFREDLILNTGYQFERETFSQNWRKFKPEV